MAVNKTNREDGGGAMDRQEVEHRVVLVVVLVAIAKVVLVFATGVALIFLGGMMMSDAPVSDVTFGSYLLADPQTPLQWAGVALRWLGTLIAGAGTLSAALIVVVGLFSARRRVGER